MNPNEMLRGLSTISIPTEALKITSSDGKLLEQTTCTLLFKVRIIEKNSPTDYLGRTVESALKKFIFESELNLVNENGDRFKSGDFQIQFAGNSKNINEMSFPRQTMWSLKNFVKKSLSLSVINHEEIDGFLKPAKLKINIQWSGELKLFSENKENGATVSNGCGDGRASKRQVFTRSRSTGSIILRRSIHTAKSNENIQCLVYQFIHRTYRQKTEIWGTYKCPWCTVKPKNLYILLKHLTLCHDRFKFKYVPGSNETRIDVFINNKRADDEKLDPLSRLSTKFKGQEPHKRKSLTNILVNHPERSRPKLAEFLVFDVNDTKRTFFHSTNGLPLHATEIDIDSEDEIDPFWLRQNTARMIDEFVDVNDGEKEIMKLWNLFTLKHAVVSESQIPDTAILFVERHGEFILANNLKRNFIIHLSNLFDYGLISDADFYKCVQRLQIFLVENQSLRDVLVQRHDEQMKYSTLKSKSKANMNNTISTPVKEQHQQQRLQQKRPSNHIVSTIKKRLRSHSRSDSISRHKIKRTDAMRNHSKKIISSTPSHRAARKSTKTTA